METTRQIRGSTIAAVIVGVVILAAVVFAGLRLNQARNQLMGEVDVLQSELSTAEVRIGELQNQVSAERAARAQAEQAAKETETAASQARTEFQSEQETLNSTIQELQASIQEFEQRVATADEARTQAEAQLAREAEMRKAVEEEVASIKDQLQQQEALIGQVQGPARKPAEAGAGSNTRAASTAAAAESEPGATASTAAKQKFPAEENATADANAAFDTPPKPVDLVSPEYPPSLRREGTEGNVTVAFTVDTRGRVQDVEVREATNEEFQSAAVDAIRKWRFKPALRDGEPVEVRISQRLSFTNN